MAKYIRIKSILTATLISLVSGVMMALSLPPFSMWYLGIFGVGLFGFNLLYVSCEKTFNTTKARKYRFLAGVCAGLSQYVISLWWVNGFAVLGTVVLVIIYSLFFGLLALLCTTYNPISFIIAYSSAFTLGDFIKSNFPFGGLPIGSLDLPQVLGPLKYGAKIGGGSLIEFMLFLIGGSISVIAFGLITRDVKSHIYAATFGVLVVIALTVFGEFSPASGISVGQRNIALVQGGGQRGLRAVTGGNAQVVYQNALNATQLIPATFKPDLILWPEDVVALNSPLQGSPQQSTLRAIASSYHSCFIAGVTSPVGNTSFLNLAVAFDPNGLELGTYLKVHRVPFGEYMPYRSFFAHFGNVSLVPRDAIAGKKPGYFKTPCGNFGVMISYEVFYGSSARASVNSGANLLVVPTNTASYSSDQVPGEEVMADSMRAIETGRDLIQASPTGYSTIVLRSGKVTSKSGLGNEQLILGKVNLYSGLTLYDKFGSTPVIIVILLTYLGSLLFAILRKKSKATHSQ
ncbi:MAG: apolipoprotein N-acyltransferase [Acidimicrobiales bacterium]|nr:apolipoprotein N-acyltransferase [Acidimicrobiales bacterium]